MGLASNRVKQILAESICGRTAVQHLQMLL